MFQRAGHEKLVRDPDKSRVGYDELSPEVLAVNFRYGIQVQAKKHLAVVVPLGQHAADVIFMPAFRFVLLQSHLQLDVRRIERDIARNRPHLHEAGIIKIHELHVTGAEVPVDHQQPLMQFAVTFELSGQQRGKRADLPGGNTFEYR